MTQVRHAASHDVTPAPVPRTLSSYPLLPTLTKVAALGVIVLFAYQYLHQSDPQTLSSLKAVEMTAVIPTFSLALARFMHPGMWMVAEGTRSCQWVRDVNISCEQIAAFRDRREQSEKSVAYQQALDHLQLFPHLRSFELKPFPDEPPSNIQVVNVGHNPQTYTNYQKALKFLEDRILKNEGFFNESPQTLLETIGDTHKIIMKKLPYAAGSPGTFRTKNVLLTISFEFNDLAKQLSRYGNITDEEYEHFYNSYKKIERRGGFDNALLHFSQEEVAVWKKAGLKTLPSEIASKMTSFANMFKTKMQLMFKARIQRVLYKGYVVETAAWVHQSIVNIHPFTDGNGRLARVWMNTVLQLGGIQGVLFYDEDSYTKAICTDQREPGHFTQFLGEIIEWNERTGCHRALGRIEEPLE